MDTLRFTCMGMKNGTKLAVVHTGRGQDISPAFCIQNLSADAKTLAITLEDIKHPLFKDFTHWLIWNIPASQRIAEAIPGGRVVPGLENARQGLGYGLYKYAGPKPPKGRRHVYRFTIYALDSAVNLRFPPTKNRFIRKAKGHIIQWGSIICEFE